MSAEVNYYKKQEPKKEGQLVVRTTGKKNRSKLAKNVLLITGAVVVVFLLLASAYVNFLRRPLTDQSGQFEYFEVKSGQSTRQIGQNLQDKKIIRSGFVFYISVKFGKHKPLQAGYYKLSPSMKLEDIISKIEAGEVDANTIVIPEGYRVLQIAKLIYDKAGVDYHKFIEAATGTEGSLFPDTYMFPTNYEPSKMVREMKDNFEKKTAKLSPSEDQLILASIVEREAKADDERAKIAAAYKKRADNNMLLQADPTVRYGLDSQQYLKDKNLDFTMWKGISRADIQSLNSPFNTYKQKGYPPAPICNPGLKSIEAALNPEKDFDYLYFFHDKDGKIHFSKTYQEHLEAIQKYGVSGQ